MHRTSTHPSGEAQLVVEERVARGLGLIAVVGAPDERTRRSLSAALAALVRAGGVVVDLRRAEQLDAPVVHLLEFARRAAVARGAPFVILGDALPAEPDAFAGFVRASERGEAIQAALNERRARSARAGRSAPQ